VTGNLKKICKILGTKQALRPIPNIMNFKNLFGCKFFYSKIGCSFYFVYEVLLKLFFYNYILQRTNTMLIYALIVRFMMSDCQRDPRPKLSL
jgi:hypothetical protein